MMTRVGWRPTSFLVSVLLLAWAAGGQADTIRLKNGRVIHGQVVRFHNGEFIILLERSDAHPEHRDRMIVLADTVESIEFDVSRSAPTPAETLVVLDSQQEVVASGIHLRRGDRVRITASGEMQFADGRLSGPAGLATRESWPFPGERFGVLIALVGDPDSSIYHVIGESGEFTARTDGELFLQINAGSLEGARGVYTARILLLQSAAPEAQTSPSAPRPLRHELNIPADQAWTDSGINLRDGDTLRIRAEGTIHFTSSKTCDPDGGAHGWGDLLRALPVNDVGRGALIGLIGESGRATPFFVGTTAEFEVEKRGRLFLGINDDNYDNNRGHFHVQIEVVPARP